MKLFGKTRIVADMVHIGWGSLGKGIQSSYANGCQFLKELRQNGIELSNFNFFSPETVARQKNSFSIREFRAASAEISKLLEKFLPGTIHCNNSLALGGGTGNFGILSLPMICQLVEFTTAQIYFTQEIFSGNLAPDEKIRKFLNVETQLALLGKTIERCYFSVELISMTNCIRTFGNSYELVDAGILECMSIFNGASGFNSHFDLEDILADPRFRARTISLCKIPVLKRYESNITRIYHGISQLTPLFDPKLFSQNASSNAIGSPFIILAGLPELVEDAQQRFGVSSTQATSLDEIHQSFGSTSITSLSPTLISFPIEGLSNVYILGIFPIDFDWLKNQCRVARELMLNLNGKVAKGQADSALAKVYKLMLAQVGNPDITEFIGG